MALGALSGCVMKGTYDQAMDEAAKEQRRLQGELGDLQDKFAELSKAKSEVASEASALGSKLEAKSAEQEAMVKQFATEKEAMLAARQALVDEKKELAAEVEELKRMRAAAEERSKEFKNLLAKLAKMIDAGNLEVKIRNGLMLVTLPSDVLFEPGKANLKDAAVQSIKDLAKTLKTFKGRRFQVIGHSDNQPISNEEFPSNWELSTQRAVEVVKVLVSAGVPASMLTSAGAASYDPVAKNNNRKNRAKNRRVELIFMPKIAELPGFDEALGKKK